MNLPALRRPAPIPAHEEPTDTVIHDEVLDGATGGLLTWGSTNSLDALTTAADRARADNGGRWTLVHRVPAESWKIRKTLPPVTGTTEAVHLNRIQTALLDLERAVVDALKGEVAPATIDKAARPVLDRLRTVLHSAERGDRPVDLDEYEPAMCDGFPDNLDRAAWAAEAVRAFGLRTRQIGPHGATSVDAVEEMAADLTDALMHLLDAIGGNSRYTVLERGYGYYLEEVAEEAEDLRALLGAG